MSDSEDEAAFASADEGDDKTQEQLKSKPTEDKQKEQPKPKEEKDKSQNQGKSKNVKAENPNPAKGKGKSQDQVKTQPQVKQQGGKKGKGGKGKKAEKKEKSEEKTADEPVSEPAAAKSPEDTEETVQTETEEAVQTETDKQSKTEDKITQEKTGTESTESRLSGDLPTESNKKEEIKSGESSESKDIDDKPVVSKSEKDSPETTESKSTTDDKEAKKDPKSALDQLATDKESGDSWSWGNWGSSLIDVASSSVSTFTHQVGEGFNTIMDTVETSLGAPSPEELILLQGIKEKDEEVIKTAPEDTSMDRAEDIDKDEEEKKTEEEETKETEKESEKSSTASGGGGGGSWFSGWGMSSLTSVVQNTTNIVQNKSKHLVSGGLDVLETIGKKTMDVIKDHDPGLTLTKSLFLADKGDKQNLSMILREAKEEAAKKAEQEKEFEETRKAHFGCMFDEYQGLAHLEALEILSNQCEKKVQILLSSMPPEVLAGIKQELIQIKQVFEMEEDEEEEEEAEHEFSKLVTEYLSEFHLGTTPDKLNKTQEKIRKTITDFYEEKEDSTPEPKMVHQAAIQSLAELTSKSVEQFHKAGELVLLQKDSDKKFLDRSKSLSSFTKVLCTEVGILSTKFSHCLNKLAEDMEDNSSVNPLVTNVYLEAQNSSTYIQDAFQLLLPCLQQSLIESTANT